MSRFLVILVLTTLTSASTLTSENTFDESDLLDCGCSLDTVTYWFKARDLLKNESIADVSHLHTETEWNELAESSNKTFVDAEDGFMFGTTKSSFKLPVQINPTSYTFIHVSRYYSPDAHPALGYIWINEDLSWFSGFEYGRVGEIYHHPSRSLNDANNDGWLISVDRPYAYDASCHTDDSISLSVKEMTLSDNMNIGINIYSDAPETFSDWAVFEVLVFDQILDDDVADCVQGLMEDKYAEYLTVESDHFTLVDEEESSGIDLILICAGAAGCALLCIAISLAVFCSKKRIKPDEYVALIDRKNSVEKL